VDSVCDSGLVLEGIAASKGEADAADADVLSRYASDGLRRCAVLACLVHTARSRARDDLAQMLCKRMAVSVKKAKDQLEEFRRRQRSVMEQLIGAYQQVLHGLARTRTLRPWEAPDPPAQRSSPKPTSRSAASASASWSSWARSRTTRRR